MDGHLATRSRTWRDLATVGSMPTLVHEALLYAGLDDFLEGTTAFARDGLAAGERVMVAVPEPRLRALRHALDGAAGDVGFLDMGAIGRNPGRIIPAVAQALADTPGRRLRWIGEPVWPGRRPCEAVEGERHEALLNVAFGDAPISILCPYDASRLDAGILAGAQRTHPTLCVGGHRRDSMLYGDPCDVATGALHPLAPAPAEAAERPVDAELPALRRFVAEHARAAGLDGSRLDDLLLAANEGAANTLLHGDAGVVRIWHDASEVLCEVADRGTIDDPLAGRHLPDTAQLGGRGLWLAHQLCDLVELRSGADGTVLRLHMALDSGGG
jgi:anti-sigma regulatory factor (Ser/Thr protein kinase)